LCRESDGFEQFYRLSHAASGTNVPAAIANVPAALITTLGARVSIVSRETEQMMALATKLGYTVSPTVEWERELANSVLTRMIARSGIDLYQAAAYNIPSFPLQAAEAILPAACLVHGTPAGVSTWCFDTARAVNAFLTKLLAVAKTRHGRMSAGATKALKTKSERVIRVVAHVLEGMEISHVVLASGLVRLYVNFTYVLADETGEMHAPKDTERNEIALHPDLERRTRRMILANVRVMGRRRLPLSAGWWRQLGEEKKARAVDIYSEAYDVDSLVQMEDSLVLPLATFLHEPGQITNKILTKKVLTKKCLQGGARHTKPTNFTWPLVAGFMTWAMTKTLSRSGAVGPVTRCRGYTMLLLLRWTPAAAGYSIHTREMTSPQPALAATGSLALLAILLVGSLAVSTLRRSNGNVRQHRRPSPPPPSPPPSAPDFTHHTIAREPQHLRHLPTTDVCIREGCLTRNATITCDVCETLGAITVHYCSEACMDQDAAQHMKKHDDMRIIREAGRALRADATRELPQIRPDSRGAGPRARKLAIWVAKWERSGGQDAELVRKLDNEIAHDQPHSPQLSWRYLMRGGARFRSADHRMGMQDFLLGVPLRREVGAEDWHFPLARAFNCWYEQPTCHNVAAPAWLTDVTLLEVSLAAVQAVHNVNTHNMRARVLAGLQSQEGFPWQAAPRSSQQLLQAADHFHQAIILLRQRGVQGTLIAEREMHFCIRQAWSTQQTQVDALIHGTATSITLTQLSLEDDKSVMVPPDPPPSPPSMEVARSCLC
jgi:hypothetical protein